jgi:hypothetical protein
MLTYADVCRCTADTAPALRMCAGQRMAPISYPSALLTRTSASGASPQHITHTPPARHLWEDTALANSKTLALVVVHVGHTRLGRPSRSSRVLMTDLFRLHACSACCNTATALQPLCSAQAAAGPPTVQAPLSCFGGVTGGTNAVQSPAVLSWIFFRKLLIMDLRTSHTVNYIFVYSGPEVQCCQPSTPQARKQLA